MSHAVWPIAAVATFEQQSHGGWRRLLLTALAALLVVGSVAVAQPAAVRADDEIIPTEAERVIAIAESYLGTPYKFSATGPDYFDCSGFVFRVYKKSGLIDRIGGKRRTATGYWKYFRRRGLADKLNPLPGDLIIWKKGGHIGMYVGDGVAIDATPERGVGYKLVFTRWSLRRLTAFLHVDLTR